MHPGLIVLCVILAILAALVIVVLVRTARAKSPAPEKRLPPSRNKKEQEALARDFARLIQIPTPSHEDGRTDDLEPFARLQAEVDVLFPKVRENLEKVTIEGVLIYHWKGKHPEKKPILLMGHQDVVPADPKGWTYPPYGGEIHDGILYGRGTMDDKCNIFCQLRAVEDLLSQGFLPDTDVWFAYSDNEESSGGGAQNAVDWFRAHGITSFALAWDEGGAVVDKAMAGMDRPYAVVGITEKGYVDLKITARGAGGHSSTPKKDTTMTRLAAFVTDVNEHNPFERKFTPHVRAMFTNMAPSFPFGLRLLFSNLWLFEGLLTKLMPKISSQAGALLGTTCAFTMAKGSDAANVIPSEAYVIANLRPGFTQNAKESVAALQKVADRYQLELTVLKSRDASPVTSTEGTAYQYLVSCIRRRFPDCGVSPYVMTGCTDNRHYASMSDQCLRFYPVRLTDQQLSCMHGDNECISIDALSDAADFYEDFLKHYVGA